LAASGRAEEDNPAKIQTETLHGNGGPAFCFQALLRQVYATPKDVVAKAALASKGR
jgi:hypothetical protein